MYEMRIKFYVTKIALIGSVILKLIFKNRLRERGLNPCVSGEEWVAFLVKTVKKVWRRISSAPERVSNTGRD
jgi:hypothetical protein